MEPAYLTTFSLLQERILAGEWDAGTRMPSEHDLCGHFGISRITLRHAMRLLEEKGLVSREPGRGTFVREIRPQKIPILKTDFPGSLRKEAPNVSRSLLVMREEPASSLVAASMQIPTQTPVLYAERLDSESDEILAIDHVWLPLTLAKNVSADMLARLDFLPLWLEQTSQEHGYTEESVEAMLADASLARKLNLRKGAAILRQEDLVHDKRGNIVARFDSYYRGDRFRLLSTVRNDNK